MWEQLASTFVSKFGGSLGSSLGGGAPDGPSSAASAVYDSGQSGTWNVNFSGTQSATGATVPGLTENGNSNMLVMVAGVVLVAVLALRKK
jgi:hypothetical protein